MAIRLHGSQLWVRDQDEALDFYETKVGMELRTDVLLPEVGNLRWLTVGPTGQPEVSIVLLAIPEPPIVDTDTAQDIATLMAKGLAGTVFLVTDDVHAEYAALSARGVQFHTPPRETAYGVDSGFYDPSGNHIRLTQVQPSWAAAVEQEPA